MVGFKPCVVCGAANADFGLIDAYGKHYVYAECKECGHRVTAELYDDEYAHRTVSAVKEWAMEVWNDGK